MREGEGDDLEGEGNMEIDGQIDREGANESKRNCERE